MYSNEHSSRNTIVGFMANTTGFSFIASHLRDKFKGHTPIEII